MPLSEMLLLIKFRVLGVLMFLIIAALLFCKVHKIQRTREKLSNTTIIIVTPTHKRPERLADMISLIVFSIFVMGTTPKGVFRLSQTLSHVRKVHWIVVEDGMSTAPAVNWILRRSGLPFVYLATVSADGMPRRGWTHRNLALQYVRENYDENANAVVYFADDDNSYDIRLFDNYIRNVKRIGVWAVGLVGGAWVEAPHVASNSQVIAWDVIFAPNRPFATDMAGFAINIKELFRAKQASFNSRCAKSYKEGPESCFLSQFGFRREHLEPFGYKDFPKEVLVWHTRTTKTKAKGPKYGYEIE